MVGGIGRQGDRSDSPAATVSMGSMQRKREPKISALPVQHMREREHIQGNDGRRGVIRVDGQTLKGRDAYDPGPGLILSNEHSRINLVQCIHSYGRECGGQTR